MNHKVHRKKIFYSEFWVLVKCRIIMPDLEDVNGNSTFLNGFCTTFKGYIKTILCFGTKDKYFIAYGFWNENPSPKFPKFMFLKRNSKHQTQNEQ